MKYCLSTHNTKGGHPTGAERQTSTRSSWRLFCRGVFALGLLTSLAACGKNSDTANQEITHEESPAKVTPSPTAPATPEPSPPAEATDDERSKVKENDGDATGKPSQDKSAPANKGEGSKPSNLAPSGAKDAQTGDNTDEGLESPQKRRAGQREDPNYREEFGIEGNQKPAKSKKPPGYREEFGIE